VAGVCQTALPIHPLLRLQQFLQVRITATVELQIITIADMVHRIIRRLQITGVRPRLITPPLHRPDPVTVLAPRLFRREYVRLVSTGCLIPAVGACQMEEHTRQLHPVHHIRQIPPVQRVIMPVQQGITGTVQVVLRLLVLPVIRKVAVLIITTGPAQVARSITAKPIALTHLAVVTPDFIGTGLVVSLTVLTVLIVGLVVIGMVILVWQAAVMGVLVEAVAPVIIGMVQAVFLVLRPAHIAQAQLLLEAVLPDITG